MNKKILVGIVLFLVIISTVYLFTKPEEEIYYSEDPITWIQDKTGGVKQINVDSITKGDGWDADDQLFLIINGSETVFPYEGYYKGKYFDREHTENGEVKMRVASDFKPNDGIIEGYIVERFINNTFEVFLFVDEDWKKQLPVTNIIWGADYSKSKQFIFNEVLGNIYMDKIIDDPSRFDWNYRQSNTGIILGNVNQFEVQNGIVDETTTAIIFQ